MIKPAGMLGFWGRQLGETPGTLNALSMSTLFVCFETAVSGTCVRMPPSGTEGAVAHHTACLPAGLQLSF